MRSLRVLWQGESEGLYLGGIVMTQILARWFTTYFHDFIFYKWLFLDILVLPWCYSCPANTHHAFANPQLSCVLPPAVTE